MVNLKDLNIEYWCKEIQCWLSMDDIDGEGKEFNNMEERFEEK